MRGAHAPHQRHSKFRRHIPRDVRSTTKTNSDGLWRERIDREALEQTSRFVPPTFSPRLRHSSLSSGTLWRASEASDSAPGAADTDVDVVEEAEGAAVAGEAEAGAAAFGGIVCTKKSARPNFELQRRRMSVNDRLA